MKRHLIPPFRSGPWTAVTRPDAATDVDGVAVSERLAARSDAPGAVVKLANGRYAVLGGDTFAVGHPMLLLQMVVTRRAREAQAEGDRAWWSTVRAVLRERTAPARLVAPAAQPASA